VFPIDSIICLLGLDRKLYKQFNTGSEIPAGEQPIWSTLLVSKGSPEEGAFDFGSVMRALQMQYFFCHIFPIKPGLRLHKWSHHGYHSLVSRATDKS